MTCPYCGKSENVTVLGVPTAALLLAYAPMLGLPIVGMMAAATLALAYKASDKKIYKCNDCDKYFIA